MKKFISAVLATAVIASAFAGCSSKNANTGSGSAASGTSSSTALKTIVVGASPTPHAEILNAVKDVLKQEGYDLEVKEFTDYVQPNLALENKEIDANYFQHQPYLDDFNKEHNTDIVSAGAIHFEPLGLYGGKTKSLDAVKDNAVIAVPNDTTNEARALLLLEAQGLIKLKDGAGLKATVNDIAENPHKIQVKEVEAAQVARSLPDVDFAVINGNYAIDAGLKVSDALAKEDKDSAAAQTYANIIAVRAGDENREDIQALVNALKSDTVKKFMEDKYQGAVVPVF